MRSLSCSLTSGGDSVALKDGQGKPMDAIESQPVEGEYVVIETTAAYIAHFTPEADRRSQLCLDDECYFDKPRRGSPALARYIECL